MLTDGIDAGWTTPHSLTHRQTWFCGLYNARGFVRDAAEVGRVWGSFRRSTFRREGGVVFRFHTETSTGRPNIDEPRPRLASSTLSSTSPFRTAAPRLTPRSGFGCEFCGCFTLQYGILQHMAVHRVVQASCWALVVH